MATITEDFVSFETAKLLKEKGFDEPCFAYYSEYWDNWKSFRLWRKFPKRSVPNKGYLNVPTLQMAMKWLREVHNLSIEPYYDFVLNWVVELKHIGKFTDIKEFEYIREKTYKSYEDACEAAIKYCLENLI